MEIYSVNLCIQSEYGKKQTIKAPHFSRSVCLSLLTFNANHANAYNTCVENEHSNNMCNISANKCIVNLLDSFSLNSITNFKIVFIPFEISLPFS